MPRATLSKESQILQWFLTAPLQQAGWMLGFVKDAVKQREQRADGHRGPRGPRGPKTGTGGLAAATGVSAQMPAGEARPLGSPPKKKSHHKQKTLIGSRPKGESAGGTTGEAEVERY